MNNPSRIIPLSSAPVVSTSEATASLYDEMVKLKKEFAVLREQVDPNTPMKMDQMQTQVNVLVGQVSDIKNRVTPILNDQMNQLKTHVASMSDSFNDLKKVTMETLEEFKQPVREFVRNVVSSQMPPSQSALFDSLHSSSDVPLDEEEEETAGLAEILHGKNAAESVWNFSDSAETEIAVVPPVEATPPAVPKKKASSARKPAASKKTA